MRSKPARTRKDHRAVRPRGPAAPLISVAFVAGIFFVPLVIMTGLMTEPRGLDGMVADTGPLALRGTFDGQSLGLRPSED